MPKITERELDELVTLRSFVRDVRLAVDLEGAPLDEVVERVRRARRVEKETFEGTLS